MNFKDYFISEITKLGFRLGHNKNNGRSHIFIRIKQYRVLTYNKRFPFKLLEKKNCIDMTENEDGSLNIDYDYKISNIYDVFLDERPIADVGLRNIYIEDVYDKSQIVELLETIKNDIKEVNIIKLEEFSWR